LGLVFAFARPEPISRTFPVVFFLQRADKLPIVIPFRPFGSSGTALALPDRLRQKNPGSLEEPPGTNFGDLVYHDLLQMALIDWISSRHFGTWRVRMTRFDYGMSQEEFGPAPDAQTYRSKVLTEKELTQAMAGNRFAGLHSGFGKLALPPRTELTIEGPREGSSERRIRFKNRLCDFSIWTRASFAGVGLGPYARLVGLPQGTAQELYWQQQYIVRLDATFSRLFIGDPNMSAHREWVTNIIDGLASNFDEETIWRRTSENFMLTRHLPPSAENLSVPMGPMRWASAP
jgi:hypothetical protein